MKVHQSGKGYTWAEPTEGGMPRLFKTARGAEASKQAWARGTQRLGTRGELIRKVDKSRSPNDWIIKEIEI